LHISTGYLGIFFQTPKESSPPSPPSPYHNLPFSANNLPLSRNNGRLLPHFSFTTVRWSRGRPSAVVTAVSLPAAGAAPSGSKPSLRVSYIAFSYCCSFFYFSRLRREIFQIIQNRSKSLYIICQIWQICQISARQGTLIFSLLRREIFQIIQNRSKSLYIIC